MLYTDDVLTWQNISSQLPPDKQTMEKSIRSIGNSRSILITLTLRKANNECPNKDTYKKGKKYGINTDIVDR